mmetsp:Transcript_27503/g.78723  ORF Transcript_27503/g.78723 Transcript_27503/m.78723 type:complete len:810 (+) Transcript_27503:58-2487(+)
MSQIFDSFRKSSKSKIVGEETLALAKNAGEPERRPPPPGSVAVWWNNRECCGTALHKAVLAESLEEVRDFLDADPECVHQRFSYETSFQGKSQEGSGEPIHLAVTRQSVEILQLLIERRASLDSMVTRDRLPHYDVLHAAVFCEGRGGQSDIVKCLLDAKAPPTQNLEGHYPLHKAYQTGGGAFGSISILRDDMEERGLLKEVEESTTVETPLLIGIKVRKLTGEQLSQVASLTPFSLKVFLNHEPLSIPSFMERYEREHAYEHGKDLAEHVTLDCLCKCLREYPLAAGVLLTCLTGSPEVENPGWHPLPTRMSFASQTRFDYVKNFFNPPKTMYSALSFDDEWLFDSGSFEAPPWHQVFETGKQRPIFDVSVEVCFLPEVTSTEFFCAVLDANEAYIYENKVTRGALDVVWWGGAYKVDILQLFVTIVGLVLLLWDRFLYDLEIGSLEQQSAQARMLRPHGAQSHGGDEGSRPSSSAHLMETDFKTMLAHDFIGARGIIDIFYELLQLGGYVKKGMAWKYFDAGNMFDIGRAILAFMFYCESENLTIQACLILLYWFRLLEVSFSENLMRELLPITQLVKGLAPSSVVCLIAVLACTHAKWVMEKKPLWPDTFYDSFTLLITAGLPEVSSSGFNLCYAFFAVCSFSVFFLNIFIGVIGENYANEKDSAAVSLLRKKSGLCCTFLMRAQLIPCNLMSRRLANALLYTGIGVILFCAGAKILCPALHFPLNYPLSCFVLAQFMCMLACYQDPEGGWAKNARKDRETRPRYIWMACQDLKEAPSDEARLQSSISDLKTELSELMEMLKSDE